MKTTEEFEFAYRLLTKEIIIPWFALEGVCYRYNEKEDRYEIDEENTYYLQTEQYDKLP